MLLCLLNLCDVGMEDFMPLVGHYIFSHNCGLFLLVSSYFILSSGILNSRLSHIPIKLKNIRAIGLLLAS